MGRLLGPKEKREKKGVEEKTPGGSIKQPATEPKGNRRKPMHRKRPVLRGLKRKKKKAARASPTLRKIKTQRR